MSQPEHTKVDTKDIDITTLTERQKMKLGLPFDEYCEEFYVARRNSKLMLQKFRSILAPYTDEDRVIYDDFVKEHFPNVGPNSFIETSLMVDYGDNIYTGKNFYANVNCVLLDVRSITFGDNVFLGPGVHIYTASHPLDKVERRGSIEGLPVVIGDDCWLGGGSVICPGVTLGNGVVVAAGSVVTKSFGDDVLLAGVPAVVKKRLNGTDTN